MGLAHCWHSRAGGGEISGERRRGKTEIVFFLQKFFTKAIFRAR